MFKLSLCNLFKTALHSKEILVLVLTGVTGICQSVFVPFEFDTNKNDPCC